MREALRYLTPEKLEIFIKIPVFLHINQPDCPGFTDPGKAAHGIWGFRQSGFYKEALETGLFTPETMASAPAGIPAILGLYHIGSLGTFTQSPGSDFDFWIIIDKKQFSRERFEGLEIRLDAILKYCREIYHQEVSFFVMDHRDVRNNRYASYDDQDRLSAPRIFLKEEFYRTFLLIAGKIPLWCVLPDFSGTSAGAVLNEDGVTAVILSLYEDLIDLGRISAIPMEDVLKGLLWHICKSEADPVKAMIKATMIYSYGFGATSAGHLLCDRIREGYARAAIDDFSADPYKIVFDQILEFHEKEDSKRLNLIKNAVFLRLCEYPDVKLPEANTPKRILLEKYIRSWKLSATKVGKLLAYPTWAESEKLLLEKTFIHRLAQMYNLAVRQTQTRKTVLDFKDEKQNWIILKNKTRARLNKKPEKIPDCSTYLKRRRFKSLVLAWKQGAWEVDAITASGMEMQGLYHHSHLLGALGWVLVNQLYKRQHGSLCLAGGLDLFESVSTPVDPDRLYMVFQPLKPISDQVFEQEPRILKLMLLLSAAPEGFPGGAECLVSNTWGELFFETIPFPAGPSRQALCRRMAGYMARFAEDQPRPHIFQYGKRHDPDIVHDLKKAYLSIAFSDQDGLSMPQKPFLDKL